MQFELVQKYLKTQEPTFTGETTEHNTRPPSYKNRTPVTYKIKQTNLPHDHLLPIYLHNNPQLKVFSIVWVFGAPNKIKKKKIAY